MSVSKRLVTLWLCLWAGVIGWRALAGSPLEPVVLAAGAAPTIDAELAQVLANAGFTGTMQSQFVARLGRPVNPQLADLGRLLWFDKLLSLHHDNACGGCHSPTNGFGDSQPMAIGIQNNNVVGPRRQGPRNQRRSPLVINAAFFPALMWNGRFSAPSGSPFDNSLGFLFPLPEGRVRFVPDDLRVRHLLQAQAHLPPTELVEVAGFTGTAGTIGPRFDQFDDRMGDVVPPPDASGFRNEPIRQRGLALVNAVPAYRQLFGESFPSVAEGGLIDFTMIGQALAEFEFTLVFADAPIDQFARGNRAAMSTSEKRGALLFFGEAGCVTCHVVAGRSNEMFSDFQGHVVGAPQIAPYFGLYQGNVIFDGPGEDEDFGLEQLSGNPADRYKFRSAPLRNVALAPAFFHNGALTRLDDAIRYHLRASEAAWSYDANVAGVDLDLRYRLGPIRPVLDRLDARLRQPIDLTPAEISDLVKFVGDSLLDSRAKKGSLCRLVPRAVPSGLPVMEFQGCGVQ
jgi:cytochrome c peroxidase